MHMSANITVLYICTCASWCSICSSLRASLASFLALCSPFAGACGTRTKNVLQSFFYITVQPAGSSICGPSPKHQTSLLYGWTCLPIPKHLPHLVQASAVNDSLSQPVLDVMHNQTRTSFQPVGLLGKLCILATLWLLSRTESPSLLPATERCFNGSAPGPGKLTDFDMRSTMINYDLAAQNSEKQSESNKNSSKPLLILPHRTVTGGLYQRPAKLPNSAGENSMQIQQKVNVPPMKT